MVDFKGIFDIVRFLKSMGVDGDNDGTMYLAFMVYRLLKDPDMTLDNLYESATTRFKTSSEDVRDHILPEQVAVHDHLTSASARFHPHCGKIMTECFNDNEFNIKDTESFLKGIVKGLKEQGEIL